MAASARSPPPNPPLGLELPILERFIMKCTDCKKTAKHFSNDDVGFCDEHWIDFLLSRIDVLYKDCVLVAKLAKCYIARPQFNNPLHANHAVEVMRKYSPEANSDTAQVRATQPPMREEFQNMYTKGRTELKKQLEAAAEVLRQIECLTNDKEYLLPVEIKRIHECAQEGWRAATK